MAFFMTDITPAKSTKTLAPLGYRAILDFTRVATSSGDDPFVGHLHPARPAVGGLFGARSGHPWALDAVCLG